MSELHHAPSPTPAAEDMPHSEFMKDGKLKIVIAGLDQNVRQQAVEAAHERLNKETNERGFVKGFIKGRIWKGNLAREYYLAKYQRQAEGEILENDNLLQHEERSDEAARAATTLRFASEFEDEVIHEGETRKSIESDDSPEAEEIKTKTKDLIRLYAVGQLDDDSFEEEKRRTMTMLAENGMSKKYIGEGLIYADNLLQIAQNVKAAVDHGKGMEDILENAEFVVGEARLGARTESRLTGTERIMKKLEGKAFVHEATVATAVSIAYSIGGWAAKSAIGAVGKLAIPGIGAGVVAAARENRMIKEERALHMREMAEGKEFNAKAPGNKRREQLEESRYESKSAKDLTDQLGVLYDDEGNLRIEGDKTRFDEAMAMVAEIQARIKISDRDKLDLISFSGVESIETERLNLDLALAKAKVDLRHLIKGSSDTELTALGMQPADINRLKSEDKDVVSFVLDSRVDATEGVLGGEIKESDRVFNKLRAKRLAVAFAKGTVLGVTLGLGTQELMALGSDNTTGLLEQVFAGSQQGDATHETLLASVFGGGSSGAEHLSGLHGAPVELSDGAKLTLPAEFQSPQIIDGKLNIMGADGSSLPALHDLPLNPDGTLSPQAIEALNSNGFHLSTMHDVVNHSVTTPETVSAEQFHAAHQNLATHVTRDFWHDNGTPRVFEGRELQLDLKYDSNGDIIFDASRMHLSEEQLRHLQMAVSDTRADQHQPFMFKFDSNGHAPVDKELQGMFHKGPNGQPVFDGKYAEASEVAGVDQNGVTHIRPFATVVGEGKSSFTDMVTHTEPQPVTSYTVEYGTPEVDRIVDVPPVLPWYPRRGLGAIEPAEAPDPDPETPIILPTPEEERRDSYYLSSYFETSEEQRDQLRQRMSPRLQGDASAELNEQEELQWYWDQQEQEHKDKITTLADDLGEMKDTVDIVAAIPVAGHQEAGNIYRTLSAYKEQSLDNDHFEIVLYVNNPETDKDGNPTSSQDTIDEIERFMRDNPDMPVKYFHQTLPRDEAKIGPIRKTLSDVVLKRGMDRGSRPDRDLIIVSNDADTTALSKVYLENFRDRLYNNPDLDAMVGQLDWDNEAYLYYPEVHVATRLFLYQNIMWRLRGGTPPTSGATTAVRLKNMAAVGGYDMSSSVGEDTTLGFALQAARHGTDKQAIGYGGNAQSRLQTSARRAIYTLEAHGDAPINQWSYEFGADDDAVRRLIMSRTEVPDYDDPAVQKDVMSRVEDMVNKTLGVYWGGDTGASGGSQGINAVGDDSRTVIERSLGYCGLEYEWAPDGRSIRVTGANRMFDGLKAFAEKAGKVPTPGTPPPPPTPPATPPPSTSRPIPSSAGSLDRLNSQDRRAVQDRLDSINAGATATAYLGSTHNYSGPMRLIERSPRGEYIFGTVDPATGGVDNTDQVILSEQEMADVLIDGMVSVPPAITR